MLRRSAAVLVLALSLAAPAAPAAAAGPFTSPAALPGLTRLLATVGDPAAAVTAVATFQGIPSPTDLSVLSSLGLTVQGLRNLPLALVSGPMAQLQAAVTTGVVRDVYPNERLRSYEEKPEPEPEPEPATSIRDSGKSLGVNVLHSRGITGKGVGVAIIDSGVDGTHPDLADHVARNMKVVGPGYPAYPSTGPNFVLPMETTGDSDLFAGHGTHVAGIVAADGTTSPEQIGVAPDASLDAYSVGELFIFSVLGAFDDILTHQAERNIRVINNSWGTSFRFFDPADPINVATKTLAKKGVVVVFAAGNDGEEMTINPFSVAPWVISVGSTTIARKRSEFSSGGVEYDNSTPVTGMAAGHHRFRGAQPGLYHPDVSAPGSNITSSSSTPGVLMVPNPPCRGSIKAPCTASISGTSMAAPHVAGLAALLLQANPKLTPSQVRVALQATTSPLADASSFARSGYGIVDAAAVDLVQRPGYAKRLETLQRAADRRRTRAEPYRARLGDHWGFTAPVLAGGGSDPREFSVAVAPGTSAVKIAVSFPGLPPSIVPVSNKGGYDVILFDAAGKEVAKASPGKAATTILMVKLTGLSPTFGTWRLMLRSVAVVSPETLTPDLPGEPPAVDSVAVTMGQLVEAKPGRR